MGAGNIRLSEGRLTSGSIGNGGIVELVRACAVLRRILCRDGCRYGDRLGRVTGV
jgi:hypothetical protein